MAIVREQVTALESLVTFPGRAVLGLDPRSSGRGPRWPGWSCEDKARIV